jgi:cytochrome c-type protein NapB
MKRPTIFKFAALSLLGAFLLSAGCDQLGLTSKPEAKSTATVQPTSFQVRAERRAFDGAPPVIPHKSFGIDCTKCHTITGLLVPSVGIAPANPHEGDRRAGSLTNCKQCHVFANTDQLFVEADFTGLRQQYQPSSRAHPLAPPVIPHPTTMRANCMACHSGQAARPEIICTHPERTNCVQCHVEGSGVTSVEMLGSTAE